MKGILFDIHQYAIYDGPGIRTTVFLKGCPLKCAWCHNPESQKLNPQISYFREKCLLCGTCLKACPNSALQFNTDGIIRNEEKCTLCLECINACPNKVMELIGKEQSDKDVIEIVTRDKPFFDNSGGGVTITGGEPTMQLEFLLKLLEGFKAKGIHTAIETCGYFNKSIIDKLVNLVDLFLFDIKHCDSEVHEQYTGVPNIKILENLQLIHQKVGNDKIIVRIPLIPSVNTDMDTIKTIASFLKEINYTGQVHLMPYNKLAKTKYDKVGMGSLYRDLGDLTEEMLQSIIKIFEENSFEVVCNR